MTLTRSRSAHSPTLAERDASPPAVARRTSPQEASLGNQAHLRRLSGPLQRKIAVGRTDDPLEHEADAAADQVAGMSAAASPVTAGEPTVSREGSATDEGGQASMHRRSRGGPETIGEAPPIVHDVLGESGQALDSAVEATMSHRFGADFSGVRVHADARAAESAAAVSAHAYAMGNHIVFGEGRYAPAEASGRRLIAHELAHTLQQSAAPTVRRDGPDVPLKEAKKEDAKEAIGGGLKEAADKLTKDDKVKELGTGLLKSYGEPIWNGASTADKVAIVAGGASLVGIPLAALASDPNGRKVLSGVPLGKALSLVPYAVIDDGSFDLPKTRTDPLLVHLTLKADDYLDLLRKKYDFLPKMTFSYEFTLSVSPDHKFSMPYGLAKFSPVPGVTLAGGYGVTPDLPTLAGPPGGPLAPYKALPSPATPAPPAGFGAFVAVDLTKIGPLKSILAPVVGDFADKR
jgi:hypothetical protein